jgi:hypothetical protein|tara:strand:- start:410 stop:526 length:117 start_codon:yes stop_codon:yes gene_type:complete
MYIPSDDGVRVLVLIEAARQSSSEDCVTKLNLWEGGLQ